MKHVLYNPQSRALRLVQQLTQPVLTKVFYDHFKYCGEF